MSPNSQLIITEAEKLGLKAEHIPFTKNYYSISDGKKTIIINETFRILGPDPVTEGERISKNKKLTYYLWAKHNLPIPQSHYINKPEDLEKIDKELVYPVLVKDIYGSKSLNVFPNIKDYKELSNILSKRTDFSKLVIQEMVFGKEYRLLVYKGQVIAALYLMPPHVIGDGVTTIASLIEQKNEHSKKKVIVNEKVFSALCKSGKVMNSIPAEGEVVWLQNNSCLSEGGRSINCTDQVHPEIRDLAIQAARIVNLSLGGIDLICDDISRSPSDQQFKLLEINTWPSLDIHHFPHVGESIPVASIILRNIFEIN